MKDSLKNKILMVILLLIILIIIVPAGIIFMYNLGRQGCIIINTTVTEGEAFGFYGAFLGFIGTVSLGALALYQNNKMQEDNKKMQEDNKKLQQKILMIEEQREKEKVDNIYFDLIEVSKEIVFIHIRNINYEYNYLYKIFSQNMNELHRLYSKIYYTLDQNKELEEFIKFCYYKVYQISKIMKENSNNSFFEEMNKITDVNEFYDKVDKLLKSRKEQKNEDTI